MTVPHPEAAEVLCVNGPCCCLHSHPSHPRETTLRGLGLKHELLLYNGGIVDLNSLLTADSSAMTCFVVCTDPMPVSNRSILPSGSGTGLVKLPRHLARFCKPQHRVCARMERAKSGPSEMQRLQQGGMKNQMTVAWKMR